MILTLSDIKAHLRIDHESDDDWLINATLAATQWCEGFQNQIYLPRAIIEKRDAFPDHGKPLCPKYAPVQSVTTIHYYDGDGAYQLWASSLYVVDTDPKPARITPAYGERFPSTRRQPNAVVLTYAAGYANGASVPASVKQAVRLLVGHWYENRENVLTGTISKEIEFGTRALLWMDRIVPV
jgi:uncharacterized phiE125 gp8 family phage protein